MKTSFLRPCLLGTALFIGLVSVAPVVQAAPKRVETSTRLEIWPGQRTLVVLPLTVSDNFLAGQGTSDTVGSNALATALVPVVSPILSSRLEGTGKFSISRPYKFDPLIRRALFEQRINDDDVNAFVDSPGLSNAANVLSQLGLDQPGMIAQVVVQQLIVGGTADMPTAQLTIRGDLYEATSAGQPFRSITVTSKPFGGKTPEDRLRAAADEAFGDIAAAFVQPPTSFQLPVPTAPAGAPATVVTGPTPPATLPSTATNPATVAPVTPGGAKTPVAPPASPATPSF